MANGTIAASQLEMLTQSGTGIITIVPPATNTNRTITLPDATGTVLTTATAGVPVNGPAFSAYQNGLSQSLTTGTTTKIQFNTEEFDTANAFDSITNYRFTPQVAGYYQVSLLVSFTTLQGTTEVAIYIYKNGSISRQLADTGYSAYSYGSSALVYLNGSTDYIEGYAYTANAGTKTIANNSAYCYFQAAMVRSAT